MVPVEKPVVTYLPHTQKDTFKTRGTNNNKITIILVRKAKLYIRS